MSGSEKKEKDGTGIRMPVTRSATRGLTAAAAAAAAGRAGRADTATTNGAPLGRGSKKARNVKWLSKQESMKWKERRKSRGTVKPNLRRIAEPD